MPLATNRDYAACRYIPLRLAPTERRLLRLLEAALNVSEYTDKVGDLHMLLMGACAESVGWSHLLDHGMRVYGRALQFKFLTDAT